MIAVSAGSDFTHVEFAALEQGEADFLQTYNSLASTLDELQYNLQSHLAQWTGSAQEAFGQAHAAWSAAMANMHDILGQLGSTIGTANENYQSAEQSIAQRWG